MLSYVDGIPLLQKVDDTMFFIEGLVEEARNLSTLVDLLMDFSGLLINCVKSAFLGFGLAQEEELQSSKALGTLIGSLPMWYLCLPLIWRKMSNIDLQPVVKKVERCLDEWQTKVKIGGGGGD